MAEITIVEAINMALAEEMQRDENVVLLGEDIGINGGVFRVTEYLQKKFGKNRVIDTPLAEKGIIGAAIGMALLGLRPVAEIQFSGFMPYAYSQLTDHAARFRSRTRSHFNVPMVVRAPHSGGFRALEHHGESQEAVYAHIPGLKVVCPSTPYDAKGLLKSAIRDNDPVIFFEPIRLYRSIKQVVPEKEFLVDIGKAALCKTGKDATIITYGAITQEVDKAVLKLEDEGNSIEIIDLRTISPIDWKTIFSSVKKTGRAIVVHEAQKRFGIGAEISAEISSELMLNLEAPVKRITSPSVPYPYFMNEKNYIPSVNSIINGVKEVLNF